MLERAFEDKLITHRDVVEGVTVEELANRLPKAQLSRKPEVVIRSGCYLTHDDGMYRERFDELKLRSPEAAALDLKMRSWALADNLQKTKAEAIGTEAALAQSNINSEGIRIEQEKAKQELKELERIKALRAAQAASGGGQAAALAKQGIVKIGNTHYTIDKGTGQWIPLDKAAAQAAKAGENGPEGGIAPRAYTTVLRANTGQKALDDLSHAIGAKRTKDGKWEIKDTKRYAESLVFGTKAYNEAQAARGQIAGEHAVIVNGGNQPSVDEKAEYHDKWHTIRPGAVVANMDNLQANIDETIRTAKTTRIRKTGEAGESEGAEP
jgi:hypothetical protein